MFSPESVFGIIYCIWCALSTVNIPSNDACGSCDLASEVKLCYWRWAGHWCFDCALSEPNHITLVSCCLCAYFCPHTDLVTVPPTESKPIHTLQQEYTTVTVVKKFQHILVYAQVPNNASWKIDITPHETVLFHWSEVDIVVKLLVITLTYHNLIY